MAVLEFCILDPPRVVSSFSSRHGCQRAAVAKLLCATHGSLWTTEEPSVLMPGSCFRLLELWGGWVVMVVVVARTAFPEDLRSEILTED